MIYEIEAFDEDAGFFSNANDKLAKEFNKIAKKRVNDGWTLHSYDTSWSREDNLLYLCLV